MSPAPCVECKAFDTKKTCINAELANERERTDSLRTALLSFCERPAANLSEQQTQLLRARVAALCDLPEEALKEHPYQRPPQATAPSAIKALHAPHFAGPRTRGSLIHLSPCARCKRRPSDAAAKLRLALSQAKLAVSELDGMLRRLQYQASIPGGVHQLRHCFDDLVAIETATSFKPALSQQAVSPRFLRRLCKLYTSFDVAVDHQIRLLHMRPGVDRTPVLGAAFAADRFREFPEGVQPPRFETGADWAQHFCKPCLKRYRGSFVELLHEQPLEATLPPNRPHQPASRPRIQELASDERGPFHIYGQTTFVVTYVRAKQSLYEVCEAVWGHWMRWQKRNPHADPDSVFYWLDIFAIPAQSLARPLSGAAADGALDQVVKTASGGVLLFLDTLVDSPAQSDVWAQWAAWQAARWQAQLEVVRPHQASRVLYLSRSSMRQAAASKSSHLRLSEGRAALLQQALRSLPEPCSLDADEHADARESDPAHICEFKGAQALLEANLTALPALTSAEADHTDDVAWVLSSIRAARTRCSDATEALRKALARDAAHLLLAKAYKEGQMSAVIEMSATSDVTVNEQVSGILPHVLLPVEGVASRATCEALQALVLAGCFDGSVVCPAGMNILHYIVMQPALLTERRNATLRLIDLAIKLGPNVNGQDFWGYTPLHLLMACLDGLTPPLDDVVQRKLVQVMLRLLQLGASTTHLTLAGERAGDLGPDFAKAALELAQGVLDGSATLDLPDANSLESCASAPPEPAPAAPAAGDDAAQERLSDAVCSQGDGAASAGEASMPEAQGDDAADTLPPVRHSMDADAAFDAEEVEGDIEGSAAGSEAQAGQSEGGTGVQDPGESGAQPEACVDQEGPDGDPSAGAVQACESASAEEVVDAGSLGSDAPGQPSDDA